jgi:hypothetical protein
VCGHRNMYRTPGGVENESRSLIGIACCPLGNCSYAMLLPTIMRANTGRIGTASAAGCACYIRGRRLC